MSKTYLDYMEDELDSLMVIFHDFLLEYRKIEKNPICFVEGYEDSYYYRPRVEARTDNLRAKFIPCKGKQGVIDIYKLIKQRREFDNCKLFYFIDKDFFTEETPEQIYITPTYSIENFYTSLEAFKVILEDVFKRPDGDPDYKNTISLFIKRQEEFHDCVIELNTLLACDREEREELGSRVSLSGVNIADYVSIDIFKVEPMAKLQGLTDKFKHISEERKGNKRRLFETKDKQKIFRGKFEFQFFCALLMKLVQDSNTRKSDKRKFFGRRVKTDLDLRKNQLLTLSTFADTPQCLVQYINRIWNSTIQENVS